ncbi:hypothetical protein AMAG_18394 [Allomyces macrogynus ATCC 38327]|uniref:DDE-1 domain-containing protein n=1 Tax=Allomyces macrogynus (strain ATCC 38327) TaxID=578462 RepID=A0A0L0S784_ALLM3|nr:hypothetical protein AMAG_18394 [Allomyces macrogynus ATCC 38327]|eukprot:KNE58281.1 hypothetical protein AMAG_18394 [Allomyces macrogynus ATCC 38327]
MHHDFEGELVLKDNGMDVKDAHVLFIYGKDKDSYWSGQHLCDQVLYHMLTMFQALHPASIDDRKVMGIWIFDNVTSHTVFAPSALIEQLLNVNNSGVNVPKMQATTWHNSEKVEHAQSLQWPDRVQKGMHTILLEHGLPVESKVRWYILCNGSVKKDLDQYSHTDCCLLHILELQPDFVGQKSEFEELLKAQGQCIMFLPNH